MLALKILAVIAIIIFLIMLIPVGVDISYEQEILTLSAMACGIKYQLFPKQKKKKEKPSEETSENNPQTDEKPSDEKAEEQKAGQTDNAQKPDEGDKSEEKPEEKSSESNESAEASPEEGNKITRLLNKFNLHPNFDEIIELLKKVLSRFGVLFGKFKINRFKFVFVAGGKEPFYTAKTFGYVNAAISALYPACRKKFKVRDNYVKTDIDFNAPRHKLDFALAFSIRIGQVFGTIFSVAFAALGVIIKSKRRVSKEQRAEKKQHK